MSRYKNPESLQFLCCDTISWNSACFRAEDIAELNDSCLFQVMQEFSLYSLLKHESVFKERGINIKTQVSFILEHFFNHIEAYSVLSTTPPHLLSTFPGFGCDWELCKLLQRRVLVNAATEHLSGDTNLTEGRLQTLFKKHSMLREICSPVSLLKKRRAHLYSGFLKGISVLSVVKVAISKSMFLLIEPTMCNFLMDPDWSYIIKECCSSLQAVSLVLRSNEKLVRCIHALRKHAPNLKKVYVNAIRQHDMDCFDQLLSVLSGVVQYKLSEGKNDDRASQIFEKVSFDDHFKLRKRKKSPQPFEPKVTFDLMDDAVLFGAAHVANQYDSKEGIERASLKFSNLIEQEDYSPFIEHHLRSWLSLVELKLQAELNKETMNGITSVLRRPTFTSLTLSDVDIEYCQLEYLFETVAISRKGQPLEKLVLLQTSSMKWDLREADNYRSKPDAEIIRFILENESPRLKTYGEFDGAKLFELFPYTMDARSQALACQFTIQNRSLTKLSLNCGIDRVSVQFILSSLACKERAIEHLILVEWKLLYENDLIALNALLLACKNSLTSLSLKFSLSESSFIGDVLNSILVCERLQALDLSNNNLGQSCSLLFSYLLKLKNLSELDIKNNKLSYMLIAQAMAHFANRPHGIRPPLKTLDVRGNCFFKSNKSQHEKILLNVARNIVCDFSHIYFR